jgi:hypothetical protein
MRWTRWRRLSIITKLARRLFELLQLSSRCKVKRNHSLPPPPSVSLRSVARSAGSLLLVTLGSVIAAGCSRDNPASLATPTDEGTTPVTSAAKADAWIGRWNGPEGTYLHIAGSDDAYEITIMDLDGARTFKGSAAGDRIEFERDGATESLRPTDGNDTGMKWLAGKANCLTVKPGEGYCRD